MFDKIKIDKIFLVLFMFVGIISYVTDICIAMSTSVFLTETALRQAEIPDKSWSLEQRDCAGFIRYVFSRVLKAKGPLWYDRTGKKAWYLRAEELISYNFNRIPVFVFNEQSYENLQTGDVIVYYNPEKNHLDAWHLMLILFPNHGKNQPLIMYHNGSNDDTAAVRKVWWNQLFEPQWKEWRPDKINPYFKGYYRWRGFSTPKAHGE